jgi:hypothetical protein
VVQVCRKHNNRTWFFVFLQLESTRVISKKMIPPGRSRGSSAHAFITYRVIWGRGKCFILESIEIMDVMGFESRSYGGYVTAE